MGNPLIEELKKQIAGFEHEASREEVGTVLEVGDGVARVSGLTHVLSQEMVEFETATGEMIVGVVLNLEEDEAGVMLLSETGALKEGDIVKRTKRILSVPVSDAVVGRTVNALGLPIDGKGAIETMKQYPMEKIAPEERETRTLQRIPLQHSELSNWNVTLFLRRRMLMAFTIKIPINSRMPKNTASSHSSRRLSRTSKCSTKRRSVCAASRTYRLLSLTLEQKDHCSMPRWARR